MKTEASIGLGTLAFIIVFVLKIVGQTDMSWFWVLTSWIWVPVMAFVAGIMLMLIVSIFVLIIALIIGK